ncbi:MAG: sulfite exporter TauE/SafE family protein, partial [Chloroflexi bacterium]|nr:sulfite exporter TauE/SafE family protein [Chloroflexota bacterium]
MPLPHTVQFLAEAFLCSVGAGVFGSLLGLGGGALLVPALTLLLGVDIHYAIGASIISVIATSSGAAVAYVRDHLSNIRLGMLLEVATTSGAITGAFVGGLLGGPTLSIIFAAVLLYSAFAMVRHRQDDLDRMTPPHPWATTLKLNNSYFDKVLGRRIEYNVAAVPAGLGLMYAAGLVSGLLGVGSGVLKVPAMDLAMKVPMKVSSTTSNFMIGVTAAASAGVFFARGQINPFIA